MEKKLNGPIAHLLLLAGIAGYVRLTNHAWPSIDQLAAYAACLFVNMRKVAATAAPVVGMIRGDSAPPPPAPPEAGS